MEVALWGTHATSFQADDLYNLGQNQPIIILLVGTLMKSYLGRPTISCSDAAKIYINPDIPQKIEYCVRLGKQMPTMSVMPACDDRYNPAINNERADTVKVEFLATMNPNEFLGKNMMSTVTIMRLASEHWWFLSCQMCHRKSFQAGSAFVCSNKNVVVPQLHQGTRYVLLEPTNQGKLSLCSLLQLLNKVSTTSNDKEPEDKEKDNTNESDKNGREISPTADSVEQIAPSTAKEQETPSSEIATASISDSPSTSKKTSKRTGTEANKSTFAKKKMHLS